MCKKFHNLIFIALVIVFIGIDLSYAQDGENILTNGGFEDGVLDPWVLDNDTPAYEFVGDAEEGSNALKVTIAAAGSQEYIPALAHPGLSFESLFLKDGHRIEDHNPPFSDIGPTCRSLQK